VYSQQQQQAQQPFVAASSAQDGVAAIHSFIAFLLSLTNADADGRIVIEPAAAPAAAAAAAAVAAAAAGRSDASHSATADRGSSSVRGGRLRYVLLNAARHFGRVVSAARSVLLVSGTLAPLEGLQAQLFPDLEAPRIRHFECGHVVPAEQLLAVSIGCGPSGRALDLRHEFRSEVGVIDELGQLLLNLCAVVPEGLVVFVPSFAYLELLDSRWSSSGLLVRLAQRKQLFK
jgi:chromosome transmission fidelity protein 1